MRILIAGVRSPAKLFSYSIMNYALVAGGLAVAYYLYVSMKKPVGYAPYNGGGAHISEDGEISTFPMY